VNLTGQINHHIKVTLLTTILREKESTPGQMTENLLVTGSIIKCTVTVYSLGLMVVSMKVDILMTKKRDMGFLHGQIIENMMVSG